MKTGGFVRWLKQDYAHVPVHQIETHTPSPLLKPRRCRLARYSKATATRCKTSY
nr:putative transporter [Klebsiella pneumoniae]